MGWLGAHPELLRCVSPLASLGPEALYEGVLPFPSYIFSHMENPYWSINSITESSRAGQLLPPAVALLGAAAAAPGGLAALVHAAPAALDELVGWPGATLSFWQKVTAMTARLLFKSLSNVSQ